MSVPVPVSADVLLWDRNRKEKGDEEDEEDEEEERED